MVENIVNDVRDLKFLDRKDLNAARIFFYGKPHFYFKYVDLLGYNLAKTENGDMMVKMDLVQSEQYFMSSDISHVSLYKERDENREWLKHVNYIASIIHVNRNAARIKFYNQGGNDENATIVKPAEIVSIEDGKIWDGITVIETKERIWYLNDEIVGNVEVEK